MVRRNTFRMNNKIKKQDHIRESKKTDFKTVTDYCFCLSREKVQGKGEDSFLLDIDRKKGIIGVFDGSGGSGSKVYPFFDGHSGAYVAARVLAEVSAHWFAALPDDLKECFSLKEVRRLKFLIDRHLKACSERGKGKSMLKGNLMKEFPSTLSLVLIAPWKEKALLTEFIWAGDSRGYLLDISGLHQVTVDDIANADAMDNLFEDAPMKNVISASHSYGLNRRTGIEQLPALVISTTDGCFGYLRSPMAFERLLLETMERSESMEQWKNEIDHVLKKISGDDYTMCVYAAGFGSFRAMQLYFSDRLREVKQKYSFDSVEKEILLSEWKEYKREYEAYQKNSYENNKWIYHRG